MTPSRPKHGHLATLKITQVRSRIGNQERVVRVLTDGLGLGRIGASVTLPDNPYTRGMVAKVAHIVRMEEIAGTQVKDTLTAAALSPERVAELEAPVSKAVSAKPATVAAAPPAEAEHEAKAKAKAEHEAKAKAEPAARAKAKPAARAKAKPAEKRKAASAAPAKKAKEPAAGEGKPPARKPTTRKPAAKKAKEE